MKTLRICKECKKEFLVEKRETNRDRGIFCSRNCSTTHYHKHKIRITKEPNLKCALCGKEFYRNKSKQKNSRSGLQFCNRNCKNIAQRIGGIKEIQPSHYSDSIKCGKDSFLNHKIIDKCDICGYSDHKEILQIHHNDRNRLNNNIENLSLLYPNCHLWEHYKNKDGLYSSLK